MEPTSHNTDRLAVRGRYPNTRGGPHWHMPAHVWPEKCQERGPRAVCQAFSATRRRCGARPDGTPILFTRQPDALYPDGKTRVRGGITGKLGDRREGKEREGREAKDGEVGQNPWKRSWGSGWAAIPADFNVSTLGV